MLQIALNQKDYKSFELFFNYFQHQKDIDQTLIYQIVMKNINQIMNHQELNLTMKNFFIDEVDYGNQFTFGKKLNYLVLPQYSTDQMFRRVDVQN